ncbi:ABC transporter substrate-binding protein [Pseudonocardia sp. CA-142604]|uniref:ABC transporter substrate-binding protein n=1 Tax=Pseudonocardia sp. CA-142604 TaxID=3240024 RepID=UPI003D9031C3
MRLRARSSRVVAAMAVALSVALLGAACGEVKQGAPGATIQPINPYGGNFAAEGTPKRGGTLLVGEDREIIGFDPTIQNQNAAAAAVYDSLLKAKPDGTVEPYLAKSMDTSDNGLTWTMGLRPDVKFSDGTPFDAQAVIINTQRHIDKVSSPAHAAASLIESMTAPDPLTVVFKLKQPMGDFALNFGGAFFGGTLGMIISPAALKKYGDQIASHPVGAGPFTFVSWTRDSKLELARNPDYWQPGMPYLDGIEFRPLPDTETRYSSMQNGDVDMIFGGYNQELVRGLANPNLNVYYGPGSAGEYMYFNLTKAPFNDRNMREAIIRAIDLKALSASQYNNQMVPAKSLFIEDSPFHTQAASDEWPTFDQAKAKQLVDAYRAAGGNPDFTFKTTTARQAFAEFIQAQMAAIGIKVDVKTYDLAQFSSSVLQSNDFQLTSWVGPFDYPDPAVARILSTTGNGNYGKYSNPQVDQWLTDAAETTDPAQRTKDYQQVELQVGKDLPLAFFTRSYLSTITKKDVKGIDRFISRDMWWATTWLDRPSGQ